MTNDFLLMLCQSDKKTVNLKGNLSKGRSEKAMTTNFELEANNLLDLVV
jgi:hypothetical protein